MAVVPYTGVRETAPPLTTPEGYQQANTNIDMFGGAQARGLIQGGAGLEQGAAAINREVLTQQETLNETMAKEGALSGVQAMTDAELKFKMLKGKEAMDALPGYQEQIRQIRAQALATMPNPAASKMLDTVMFRYLASGMTSGATHAATEMQTWQKEVAVGTAALAANQGVLNSNDPEKVAAFAGDMEKNIRLANAGAPQEFQDAKVAEALGHYYKTVLDQVAISDPSRALAMFQTVRSKLSAQTAVAIESELTTRSQAFESKGIVNGWITQQNPHPESSGGYEDRVNAAEGTGQNPRSSAVGTGQFIDSTWLSVTKKYAPEAVAGKSDAEILAMRSDKELGRRMITAYRQENAGELRAAGLPDTDANGYLSHWFGPKGAIGLLKADPSAPVASVLGQAVVDANPNIRGKTVGDVVGMVQRKMGDGTGTATISPPQPFDPDALRAYVLKNTDGNPALRDQAMAYAEHQINLQNHQLAGDRAKLEDQLRDLGPALRSGAVDAIPAQTQADIRRLLPAAKGTELLRDLDVQRQAGLFFKAAEWAGPEELTRIRTALATGSVSDDMKAKFPQLAAMTGEGGADNFRLRESVRAQFDAQMSARETALKTDPAAYANREPSVRAAFQAIDAAPAEMKAAVFQAYNTRLLAAQQTMGVLNPRLLTDRQVAEMAQKFTSTGPETGNMVGVLQGYQAQFGPQWQKAYGELVQHGKIPEGYRVLADLDQPSQVTTAADYQSVLKLLSDPHGRKVLVENAIGRAQSPTAEKDVGDALNKQLEDFQQTTSFSTGGERLYATTRDAAMNLALFYMGRDGATAKQAATKAVDGLLNAKWGMYDTMIYPKPLESQVLGATRLTAANLTAADLTVPPATPATSFMKPEERADAWARAAQRGKWVPNAGATGLNLMAQVENGGMIPVLRRDGSPVSLDFNRLPAASGSRYDWLVPAGTGGAVE